VFLTRRENNETHAHAPIVGSGFIDNVTLGIGIVFELPVVLAAGALGFLLIRYGYLRHFGL
jgi:hypothetical protein